MDVKGSVPGSGVRDDVSVIAAPDRTEGPGFEIEAGYDAEITSSSSKSPIQVGVRLVIDIRDRAVGENYLFVKFPLDHNS